MTINRVVQKSCSTFIELANQRSLPVVGLYLSGSSTPYSMNYINGSISSDLDIHVIVDSNKFNKKSYQLDVSPYGIRVEVENIPSIMQINNKVVEYGIMPLYEFNDIEGLLRSHKQFAASSNLYYTKIIYDPRLFLQNIRNIIVTNFLRKEYIQSRLKFVRLLALEKLQKFENRPLRWKYTLPSIWDGPLWALMSVGNMVVTQQCAIPTFRWHLLLVRKLLTSLNLFDDYENLLKLWGFQDFSKNTVMKFFSQMKSMYEFGLREKIENNYLLNSLKRTYWIDDIRKMINSGFVRESCFPIIYVMTHTIIQIEKHPEIDIKSLYGPPYEMIKSMGFDEKNKYKIRKIKGLLDHFYNLNSAYYGEHIIPKHLYKARF